MRSFLIISLVLGMWIGSAVAGEKQVAKIFPFSHASKEEVKEVLEAIVSPDARVVVMNGKVLVRDKPSVIEMVPHFLKEIDQPRPNVRIDLSFDESISENQSGVGLKYGVEVGDVRISGGERLPGGGQVVIHPGGSNDVGLSGRKTVRTTTQRGGQFITTQSGHPATIKVAREVPLVDYFYNYVVAAGYVIREGESPDGKKQVTVSPAVTTGSIPHVRWQSVGTQMSVLPRVKGSFIEVEITPQITALVDPNDRTVQEVKRMDPRLQVISLRELSTIVTVPDGGSIHIGGFQNANDQFNRNFFGGSSSRSTGGGGGFTLRASTNTQTLIDPAEVEAMFPSRFR